MTKAKPKASSELRPRNWRAMRQDRVLAMAQNRFGRIFPTKDAAIAALHTLPVKEQRSLRKVAVAAAQKATQSAAAKALIAGMSAAGKAAAKRVAPLALAGVVISSMRSPAKAETTAVSDKKERNIVDRAVNALIGSGAIVAGKNMIQSAASKSTLKRVALNSGGIVAATVGAVVVLDAIAGDAKASEDAGGGEPRPTGVLEKVKAVAAGVVDVATFGIGNLALNAGEETRAELARMSVAAGAKSMPPPPAQFGAPSPDARAFLTEAAARKAEAVSAAAPSPTPAAAPSVAGDGTTAGYVRAGRGGRSVQVKGYTTPDRR